MTARGLENKIGQHESTWPASSKCIQLEKWTLEFHGCRIMASCLKQFPLKEVDVATSDEHSVDSVSILCTCVKAMRKSIGSICLKKDAPRRQIEWSSLR